METQAVEYTVGKWIEFNEGFRDDEEGCMYVRYVYSEVTGPIIVRARFIYGCAWEDRHWECDLVDLRTGAVLGTYRMASTLTSAKRTGTMLLHRYMTRVGLKPKQSQTTPDPENDLRDAH